MGAQLSQLAHQQSSRDTYFDHNALTQRFPARISSSPTQFHCMRQYRQFGLYFNSNLNTASGNEKVLAYFWVGFATRLGPER